MCCAVGAAGAATSSPADPQDAPVSLQKGLESLLLHGKAGTGKSKHGKFGQGAPLGMGTDETHEGNNNPTLKCVSSGDMGFTLSLV